jgi:hypothetical protein
MTNSLRYHQRADSNTPKAYRGIAAAAVEEEALEVENEAPPAVLAFMTAPIFLLCPHRLEKSKRLKNLRGGIRNDQNHIIF